MNEFVTIPKKEMPKLLVVPGDIHFPQHDAKALRVMTSAVLGVAARLDLILATDLEWAITGDMFDSAGFSPHPSVRKQVTRDSGTVADEKKKAEPWIKEWAGCSARLRVISGNHEAWQESSPAVADGEWWQVYGDLFDSPDIHVYKEGTKLKYGRLVLCHGHDLRGSTRPNSAVSVLANYPGQNTIYGHTHRLESCTTPTTKDGRPVIHGAYTVGMLADRAKERIDRKMRPGSDRHQQGFGLVYFFESGLFKVELCEIHQVGRRYYTHAAGEEYCV